MRFAIISIVFVVLFALCTQPSEGPKTTPPQTTPSDLLGVYKGFKTMQKGDWAKWRIYDKQITTLMYIFAGREVLEGKSVSGIELSKIEEGQEQVIQIWFTDDGKAIKYVIKVPQGVFCMPISPVENENLPSTSTPDEYEPQRIVKLRYELGKHTVGGKVINVVKIFMDKNETWISGDVPFGMVRVLIEGKTVMDLLDFGSGLSLKISFNEVLNCKQVPRIG